MKERIRDLRAIAIQEANKRTADGDPWSAYDSGFENVLGDFSSVLPLLENGRRIHPISYFKELKKRQRDSFGSDEFNGIEIMGPGSRLFGDIPSGLFDATAGVTLLDKRPDSQKRKDLARNHVVIEQDVNEPDLSERIADWREAYHVVIIRPYAGESILIKHPIAQFAIMNDIYEHSAPGSVILTQCPELLRRYVFQWQEAAQGEDLEIDVNKQGEFVRIQKGLDAPQSLPALPRKKIFFN
jgi:hypothetical protein